MFGQVRISVYWFEPADSWAEARRTGKWWQPPRFMHVHCPPRASDPGLWKRCAHFHGTPAVIIQLYLNSFQNATTQSHSRLCTLGMWRAYCPCDDKSVGVLAWRFGAATWVIPRSTTQTTVHGAGAATSTSSSSLVTRPSTDTSLRAPVWFDFVVLLCIVFRLC